ncbi:MAG: hypothetical protein ABIR52_05350, partial [Casimicrobiaceae bacterium]
MSDVRHAAHPFHLLEELTMRNFRKLPTIVAAGVVSLALFAPYASAGHLNIVLEANLDGREEVRANATNNGIAGDPNGRATAYV